MVKPLGNVHILLTCAVIAPLVIILGIQNDDQRACVRALAGATCHVVAMSGDGSFRLRPSDFAVTS